MYMYLARLCEHLVTILETVCYYYVIVMLYLCYYYVIVHVLNLKCGMNSLLKVNVKNLRRSCRGD